MMQLTTVILSAILLAALPAAASEDDAANLTYTVYAAESAWLGLTTDERIKIPLYKLKQTTVTNATTGVAETVMVPGAVVAVLNVTDNATSVRGHVSDGGGGMFVHTMEIRFDEPMEADNATFDHLTLSLELHTNSNNSKWELASMSVNYKATLSGEGASGAELVIEQTDPIDVAPRRGYFLNAVELVCTKGYTICSPTWLCWTCNEQDLLPKVPKGAEEGYMAGVVIPGMKLQPFLANQTREFAYYNWDCDPLISIPVWEGLLLGLFLLVIVYMASAYITGIGGPTGWDDPTKPTISVPVHD